MRLTRVACRAAMLSLLTVRMASSQPTAPTPPASPEQATRDFLDFSATAVGDRLPPGWELRPVRGERAPYSVLDGPPDARVWRVTSAGQAGWFGYDLRRSPIPPHALLEVTFRLETLPTGADLGEPKRNDSALRVFVVFQGSGGLFARQRMLMYSFGTTARGGSVAMPRAGLCDIRLARTATGFPETVRLDPSKDAPKHCGWQATALVGVGLLHDTDQTAAPARVEITAFRALLGSPVSP